jgi:type IV pilus assembly protein PilA
MLARLQKLQEEREEGFTLIELLVVIIIIGILAAIAIPVFLNQRQKGYDAGIKSDLRNAATAEETYLTDNDQYATTQAQLVGEGFKPSSATDYFGGSQTVNIAVRGTNASYCLNAKSASGTTFYYDSAAGGLTANGGKTACS